MQQRTVIHPELGTGTLVKTYMGGFEWEVEFASGRRFRLPAREFKSESVADWLAHSPPAARAAAPREAALETDQFRARHTLEALRLGIVPAQDVETLTIGLEPERVSLERALARSKERGGDVQAVVGNYGFGKSHFVELAARRALREQWIVATASLDLLEVPPSKPHEIYRALVQSLRYPDTDAHGLAPLLRKALDTPDVIDELAGRSPLGEACPLVAALRALSTTRSQRAYDDIVYWIGGQIRPTAEMRAHLKRPPALYRTGQIARQYAYLLTAISVLATTLGYGGLAVLIDESEHYSLLRATQRDRADAFFKALIYAALGPGASRIDPKTIPEHGRVSYDIMFASDPHLFFLFALTESANRMPIDEWLAPAQIVRLDDRFIERDIREFFKTLLRYHAIAYAYEFPLPPERYDVVTQAVPGLLSRALNQHRINLREVIRLAVIVCDLLFLYPDLVPDTVLKELTDGLRL